MHIPLYGFYIDTSEDGVILLNDCFDCTISLLQTIIVIYVDSRKSYYIYYMSCIVFSNNIFSCMWNVIYENLVVKSVGVNLFNLLGSYSASSLDASSFGCVVILSVYLTQYFVVSALIVGSFKSVHKIVLDIYYGAFTVSRRTLL
jgi:hypothetical protein